ICRRPTLPQNLVTATDHTYLSVFDGDRLDEGRDAVRCDLGIMDNTVGLHAWLLIDLSQRHSSSIHYLRAAAGDGITYSGSFVGVAPWTMVYAYSTPAPYAP